MCARAWSENSQLLFLLIWSPGMVELHDVSNTSSSLAWDIAGLERPIEPEDDQVVEQEQQLQASQGRQQDFLDLEGCVGCGHHAVAQGKEVCWEDLQVVGRQGLSHYAGAGAIPPMASEHGLAEAWHWELGQVVWSKVHERLKPWSEIFFPDMVAGKLHTLKKNHLRLMKENKSEKKSAKKKKCYHVKACSKKKSDWKYLIQSLLGSDWAVTAQITHRNYFQFLPHQLITPPPLLALNM